MLFQESENPAREGGDEAVEHGAEGAQGGTKTSGVSPRFLFVFVLFRTYLLPSTRKRFLLNSTALCRAVEKVEL